MADEERQDTPQDEPTPDRPEGEEPAAEQPDAAAAEPAADEQEPADDQPAAEEQAPADDQPAAEEQPAADEQSALEQPAAEQPQAGEPAASAEEQPAGDEQAKAKPRRDRKQESGDAPEVIPGAHLEPDLVLEDEARRADELAQYGEPEAADGEAPAEAGDASGEEAPGPVSAVFDLAADARYRATGKRKSAVARITLRPGTGRYTINGKDLADYFPRATLQTEARRPLETVGQQESMDVVAKIHGGGVSAQAGALRHGITKALVEADPNLRGELKRRGFLTRDPRVKERKKAGLKKARKRPQFSKR